MSIVTNMQRAAEQVEITCFSRGDMPFARELVMMIAEIYSLPPTVTARINGEQLPIAIVQETYSMLTHELVQKVISDWKDVDYEVKRKKTYLRTALYNSVYEMESGVINDLRVSGVIS